MTGAGQDAPPRAAPRVWGVSDVCFMVSSAVCGDKRVRHTGRVLYGLLQGLVFNAQQRAVMDELGMNWQQA
jgi:hypothetical protein